MNDSLTTKAFSSLVTIDSATTPLPQRASSPQHMDTHNSLPTLLPYYAVTLLQPQEISLSFKSIASSAIQKALDTILTHQYSFFVTAEGRLIVTVSSNEDEDTLHQQPTIVDITTYASAMTEIKRSHNVLAKSHFPPHVHSPVTAHSERSTLHTLNAGSSPRFPIGHSSPFPSTSALPADHSHTVRKPLKVDDLLRKLTGSSTLPKTISTPHYQFSFSTQTEPMDFSTDIATPVSVPLQKDANTHPKMPNNSSPPVPPQVDTPHQPPLLPEATDILNPSATPQQYAVIFHPTSPNKKFRPLPSELIWKDLKKAISDTSLIAGFSSLSAGGLIVRALTAHSQSSLLSISSLANIPVTAKLPKSDTSCRGVAADIHPDLSTEYLLSHSSADHFQILSVTHLLDGKKMPTLALYTFAGPSRPKSIFLDGVTHQIRPYYEHPIQCSNCFRYAHTSKNCRSLPACAFCKKGSHGSGTCPTLQRDLPPTCVNCSGSHTATSHSCVARQVQVEIIKHKDRYKTTYMEAKNKILPKGTSFEQALQKLSDQRLFPPISRNRSSIPPILMHNKPPLLPSPQASYAMTTKTYASVAKPSPPPNASGSSPPPTQLPTADPLPPLPPTTSPLPGPGFVPSSTIQSLLQAFNHTINAILQLGTTTVPSDSSQLPMPQLHTLYGQHH